MKTTYEERQKNEREERRIKNIVTFVRRKIPVAPDETMLSYTRAYGSF